MPVSTEELIRVRLKKDYWAFDAYLFESDVESPDFHHEIISLFDNTNKFLSIAAPRQHAKTTLCSRRHNLWNLLYAKEPYTLQVSATYTQATQIIQAIRYMIDSDPKIHKMVRPEFEKCQENDLIIKTIYGRARIATVGTGQAIRGLLGDDESRPSLIICDDLDDDERVKNERLREDDWTWFWRVLVPMVDKARGRIRVIGTVLHKDSVLSRLLNTKGCESKIYRAIKDDGQPLWPEYYSLEKLIEIKQQYERANQSHTFYCEWMNNPVDPEGQEFKRDWIQVRVLSPEELKQYTITTTIDLAISKADTAHYTAIVTVAWDRAGKGYILDARRGRWGVYETINEIYAVKNQFKPVKIGIEKVAYQAALIEVFRRESQIKGDYIMVTELRAKNSKEERIRALFDLFARGQMFFTKEFPELEDELCSFPHGITDDVADCLAYQMQLMTIAPALPERNVRRDEGSWLIDQIKDKNSKKPFVLGTY